MNKITILLLCSFEMAFSQELTLDKANHLASLPIKCLQ